MIHSFTLEQTQQKVFLGRRITPKAERPPTLRFAAYFNPKATPPPDMLDFTTKAQKALAQMLGNDQKGDCVVAELIHMIGMMAAVKSGIDVVGTTDEALSTYYAACGGGDNGCNISDFLDYVRDTGIMVGGKLHKIDSYVSVDPTNLLEVKVAMYLFGPLALGVNLPGSWENSQTWDVTNSPFVGGHGIPTCGYNSIGPPIATWASTRQMTYAALQDQSITDECYATVDSSDWTGADHMSVYGFDLATLQADSLLIKNGQIPDIDPSHLFSWGGFA